MKLILEDPVKGFKHPLHRPALPCPRKILAEVEERAEWAVDRHEHNADVDKDGDHKRDVVAVAEAGLILRECAFQAPGPLYSAVLFHNPLGRGRRLAMHNKPDRRIRKAPERFDDSFGAFYRTQFRLLQLGKIIDRAHDAT